ncbi:MAG: hypothetical protein KIS76_06115 [Pyrinomonadaceae bacterium]|nr:hypothetical protein [Pyrinomonadaceae bacterium]
MLQINRIPEPVESRIEVNWVEEDGEIIEDVVCKRINFLIASYFENICTDSSGWKTLFRDPRDGRYWELSYPHSEWHGGGPPLLTFVCFRGLARRGL